MIELKDENEEITPENKGIQLKEQKESKISLNIIQDKRHKRSDSDYEEQKHFRASANGSSEDCF